MVAAENIVTWNHFCSGMDLSAWNCRNDDESMNPANRAGDLVIYDRITQEYHTGDVVVIKQDGGRQIRRVAAVSGDVVDVTEEGLSVNGYQQREADIYTETLPYKDGIDYPLTVGDGWCICTREM